ncbi:RECA_2 domain-containing protein [Haematococcus lacustris]|uniref:RECA_2 domain-containing protein n=1 Tax=Haematococcus lacustris TaxID=44745 RepID=A0A699ZW39_HAELA|nr:RECA_2 domain-containing protein [Haematococcus lacustris]
MRVSCDGADSVTFHFRQDFRDMGARARALSGMAQDCMRLAERHSVAVVFINQVSTRLELNEAKLVCLPTQVQQPGRGLSAVCGHRRWCEGPQTVEALHATFWALISCAPIGLENGRLLEACKFSSDQVSLMAVT